MCFVPEENEISFDKVDKPHDRLIKWSFGRDYVAAAHCRAYCPEVLVPFVGWDQVTSEPGSFVDPELTESHTDLLFKAPLKSKKGSASIYFYFLVEHITNPTEDTILRLAEYKLDIWRSLRAKSPKRQAFKLPVILAFVIHQGAEWKMPTRISEMLNIPADSTKEFDAAIRELELDMGCLPVVVPKGQPEKLKGHIIGRVTLAIMSAARENRSLEFFNEHGEMIRELLKERDSMALLSTLLRYMFQVDNRSWDHRQKVIKTIEDNQIQSKAMSIAEQLEARGIQKGLEKGRAEVALTLLEDSVGKLPEALAAAIAELDYETQLQLIRNAASFQSVKEIESWLTDQAEGK